MKIDLKGKDIHTLTTREALGLPVYYVPTRREKLENLFEKMRLFPKQDLMKIMASEIYTLEERITAGKIINYCGDPRLESLAPQMIRIPAFDYYIGTSLEELPSLVEEFGDIGVRYEWLLKEVPMHKVRIRSFQMAINPITNFEYKRFLLETGFTEFPSSWPLNQFPVERGNHPVYSLSLAATLEYIKWLNSLTGFSFRLPTEIEWEVAASGHEKRKYPWGDYFNPDFCNTLEAQILETTPVGIFPQGASPFGIMDMAGNVEEYTSSIYQPYPSGEWVVDDIRRQLKQYPVTRGGSFARFHDLARSTRRHGPYPGPLYAIGFRLAHD